MVQTSPDMTASSFQETQKQQKKQAKRENVVKVEEEEASDGKVIDLVQVLKKSLSGKSK